MKGDVRCAAFQEGGVEMILQVSRAISGHRVRGIRWGGGSRRERERVHFSRPALEQVSEITVRSAEERATTLRPSMSPIFVPHGIHPGKSAEFSILRPLILLSLLC